MSNLCVKGNINLRGPLASLTKGNVRRWTAIRWQHRRVRHMYSTNDLTYLAIEGDDQAVLSLLAFDNVHLQDNACTMS